MFPLFSLRKLSYLVIFLILSWTGEDKTVFHQPALQNLAPLKLCAYPIPRQSLALPLFPTLGNYLELQSSDSRNLCPGGHPRRNNFDPDTKSC